MRSRTYAIVKIFGTIQGEGALAGTPATFVRFGGCNMWSGAEAHRERDAERNGAECPRWCDTDFLARERLTAHEIVDRVMACGRRPLIVLTGGEPMLQVDQELIDALGCIANARIQVETNGTVEPQFNRYSVYVTLSPKTSRDRCKLADADELKLVWPAYDPEEWVTFPARHCLLQPQAFADGRNRATEAKLVEYVQEHGGWRLSLQTHKILGVE